MYAGFWGAQRLGENEWLAFRSYSFRMHSAEGLSMVNGTSPEPRYRVTALTSHDTTRRSELSRAAPRSSALMDRGPPFTVVSWRCTLAVRCAYHAHATGEALQVTPAENPGPPPNVPGFSRVSRNYSAGDSMTSSTS